MLEGFETLTPVVGAPTMSVTEIGISFNKSAVEKMNKAQYAKIMINRGTRQIAVVKCDEDDEGARGFLKEGRNPRQGVRWNNYDLKSEISQLMNWDLSENGKRIKGDYSKEDSALIFDLSKATNLSARSKGGEDE